MMIHHLELELVIPLLTLILVCIYGVVEMDIGKRGTIKSAVKIFGILKQVRRTRRLFLCENKINLS